MSNMRSMCRSMMVYDMGSMCRSMMFNNMWGMCRPMMFNNVRGMSRAMMVWFMSWSVMIHNYRCMSRSMMVWFMSWSMMFYNYRCMSRPMMSDTIKDGMGCDWNCMSFRWGSVMRSWSRSMMRNDRHWFYNWWRSIVRSRFVMFNHMRGMSRSMMNNCRCMMRCRCSLTDDFLAIVTDMHEIELEGASRGIVNGNNGFWNNCFRNDWRPRIQRLENRGMMRHRCYSVHNLMGHRSHWVDNTRQRCDRCWSWLENNFFSRLRMRVNNSCSKNAMMRIRNRFNNRLLDR